MSCCRWPASKRLPDLASLMEAAVLEYVDAFEMLRDVHDAPEKMRPSLAGPRDRIATPSSGSLRHQVTQKGVGKAEVDENTDQIHD